MPACTAKIRDFAKPGCKSLPTGCGLARVFRSIRNCRRSKGSDKRARPKGTRRAFLDIRRGWQDTAVYDYRDLGRSDRLAGPAVVETPTTTVALPEGCAATLDQLGNMVIRYADVA